MVKDAPSKKDSRTIKGERTSKVPPGWFWALRGANFDRLKTWRFWRTMIIFFCIFSVLGHLVEYPYCWVGMRFFGTLDPTDEVLANPFKPFFVYGVGIVLCCIFLEPLREWLLKRCPKRWQALVLFFVICVFIGMTFELGQGHLQNQPVNGEYPLWDVSDYPGNIMGQAWIVNDVLLGLLFTFIVWVILPPTHWLVAQHDEKTETIIFVVTVLLTIALTLLTY